MCLWSASDNADSVSQKFDRAQGGFGRVGKPNWKLTELKAALNEWQVDMEKAGGWNSN
jgi:alpha-glucosidase